MTIYGRGTIANAITDRSWYSYLCFGVSNRTPLTDRERERETFRIWRTPNKGMVVYISTLAIYHSPDTEYAKHKIDMENLVKARFDNYCIFRIGNVTWENDNPNTLLNFLRDKIKKNEPFEIQNTHRYLIDKDEFTHWVDLIPAKGKHEMNVTGRKYKVFEIVEMIKKGEL